MREEEVAVAKAPKDGDARDTGIGSSLNVHIAVSNVNGLILPYSKGFENCKDSIWSRFLLNSLILILTNGDFYSALEEVTA